MQMRRDREAGVQLLDVDLLSASVVPAVVASRIERRGGNYVGDAQTVRDWAAQYGAVGGLNGGYFGDTYDAVGRRKQIVGLAVVDGVTVAPGEGAVSRTTPGPLHLRSAVGFRSDGTPEIVWAKGGIKKPLQQFAAPTLPAAHAAWTVRSAVACGPRLYVGGVRRITDRDEWLVSPGKLPRAFIAYDRDLGKPHHLVVGRADTMDYGDLATYLGEYFAREHHSTPREAMCLDGGPSAQLVYRNGATLEDAEPTGVLVPTAILLVPRKTGR